MYHKTAFLFFPSLLHPKLAQVNVSDLIFVKLSKEGLSNKVFY